MRRVLLAMGSNIRSGLFIGSVLAAGILVVCSLAFWLVEASPNPRVQNAGSGFLWVTRTLIQAEPPFEPVTGVGHALYYVVVLTGVGIIALVTGAVASKLIELVMRRDAGMGEATYRDHTVICGWSAQGEEILRELHAEEVTDPRPVVILAPLDHKPTGDDLVTFVRGVPSHAEDLRRAGIDRAHTAIVLADRSDPGADPDDMDARTLLTVLAVESINPDVYTCVEVIRSANRPHFDRTGADELIVSAEVTGALLAASAKTHGLSTVIADLTSHDHGQEFYRVPVPSSLVGRTFTEAMAEVKARSEAILVAVGTGEGQYRVNPPADRLLDGGDHLLVIAGSDPSGRLG